MSLRTLASGGETVGEETAAWCRERFGTRLNEFYGQTEANLLIGNCAAWPERPGWMGRAYPGHELRLVDGEIAVRVEGDPVVFLGYWRDEAATAAKVRDGWLYTGDLAEIDDDGNYRSVGRADDLISSGGYRIGPGEIEGCLIRHPAVSVAAAIGVPDDVRGEVVKAFVVAGAGADTSPELAPSCSSSSARGSRPTRCRARSSSSAELPLTVTGKIRRGELRRLDAARAAAELTSRSGRGRARSRVPVRPARSRVAVAERRVHRRRACARGRAGCRRGVGVEGLDDRARAAAARGGR